MASLHQILQLMVEKGASDLHVTSGTPPQIRIHGELVPLDLPPLTPADTKQLIYSVLTDDQKHRFEEENDLDFSFGVKGLSRFRGNAFMQRGAVGGVLRMVPFTVQNMQELNLPKAVQSLIEKPRGLVLVTGPTGSGKSTTLASMIDAINNLYHCHIITIEDPIEFLHSHKKSIVNQREVTSDTKSFKSALRYILRQDPDVVLVGEMRDLETMEAALTIAETGHLTFGTLHTNSAIQTVNRIIDVFPENQQDQIRVQLSFVLTAVVSQQLIPRIDGKGRAMAMEIMIPTPAIRNLIREGKIHQMYSTMQTGQGESGMITMNQALCELYRKREISHETALGASSHVEELASLINRSSSGTRARPAI
jgi:twitching motility protein PilT